MVPDEFADTFEISDKASTKYIKDLPIGSRVLINIQGRPTRFIVVHQGIPWTSSPEEEVFFLAKYAPRYDETANGTWLLMEDVWEDPNPKLRFEYWNRPDEKHQNNYPEYFFNSSGNYDYWNYAVKEIVHSKYLPKKQWYSIFNIYFNTIFYNYLDEHIRKKIKKVNLPMTKNSIITERYNYQWDEENHKQTWDERQVYSLDSTHIGFNPPYQYLPENISKEEERKIDEECRNTSFVQSPFETKIFPLSLTEMNY